MIGLAGIVITFLTCTQGLASNVNDILLKARHNGVSGAGFFSSNTIPFTAITSRLTSATTRVSSSTTAKGTPPTTSTVSTTTKISPTASPTSKATLSTTSKYTPSTTSKGTSTTKSNSTPSTTGKGTQSTPKVVSSTVTKGGSSTKVSTTTSTYVNNNYYLDGSLNQCGATIIVSSDRRYNIYARSSAVSRTPLRCSLTFQSLNEDIQYSFSVTSYIRDCSTSLKIFRSNGVYPWAKYDCVSSLQTFEQFPKSRTVTFELSSYTSGVNFGFTIQLMALSSSSGVGLIAGTVSAGIGFAIIVSILACVIYRRRRLYSQPYQSFPY